MSAVQFLRCLFARTGFSLCFEHSPPGCRAQCPRAEQAMGRKALNTKFTEATESTKLRMRFSRRRGPRLHRDVRRFRRAFTRFTSHLRATRPPWNLRITQLWRARKREFSGYSEEQGLLGPLSRSS